MVHHLSVGPFAGTYNLVTGRSRAYVEIIDALKEIIPDEFKIVPIARTKKMIDQKFDNAKLMSALGGFTFTPFQQSLKETVQAIQDELASKTSV